VKSLPPPSFSDCAVALPGRKPGLNERPRCLSVHRVQTPVAVIFDMDGVLVDSAEAHRRAWEQLGCEVGTPFTAALFQQTFGQRNASIIPLWLGARGVRAITAERLDELADRKETLYREFVRQGAVRIYPGALTLLPQLRTLGARVAIASSGPRANISLLIDTIGVRAAVDALVASEDVTQGKPDPEVFLKAAEQLRVDACRCAIIEDSVHGIAAAKRAGMLAVAVLTSTARAVLLAAGADLITDDIGGLNAGELVRRVAAHGGSWGDFKCP
jgi:beta-phosphoglucomutase